MKKYIFFIFIISIHFSYAQQPAKDSLITEAKLEDCIKYALQHSPVLQQSIMDEAITKSQIKSKLAAWYPQVGLNFNYQYNVQLPASYVNGNFVRGSARNNSNIGINATQNLFNRDLLLASSSAKEVEKQAGQISTSNRIDIVVNVSKAFYEVLLTKMQIDVLDEDIIRLQRSLKDAYNQFKGGLVDKIDYKRATISLNNSNAQKRTLQEILKFKQANLNIQMGYPLTNEIKLNYDSSQLEKEVYFDTTLQIKYENRIEYQVLQTQKNLQEFNLKYYKLAYLPNVSAFGAYNPGNYYNNNITKLYGSGMPNSFIGVQFSLPIFQGNKRKQDINTADLMVKRVDWQLATLKNNINAQYMQALANYKANLNEYLTLKENLQLAAEVYHVLSVQYKNGIKTYLDVITGETDLRAAQINYTNALFQVISSKYDLNKALGLINY